MHEFIIVPRSDHNHRVIIKITGAELIQTTSWNKREWSRKDQYMCSETLIADAQVKAAGITRKRFPGDIGLYAFHSITSPLVYGALTWPQVGRLTSDDMVNISFCPVAESLLGFWWLPLSPHPLQQSLMPQGWRNQRGTHSVSVDQASVRIPIFSLS